ncbi:MAG TPA: MFS transporter [Vicinamibacterales bacterium]|nr:MFS transporter [Vicinamibacterales bacterium]
MANWFTSMNARERRTFAACFTGWALDAMDVQMYAVVMPTLIAIWSLTQAQAGTLGTAALLFSSVGGWIAGILADRFGRARVLQLTILWFALFTFLSGFTQSYEQLLLTRSLQGLGFGGEWAAGAVLMSEVIDKRVRGRAVGTVQGGWSVGYGAAVLLFTIVFSVARPEVAWRVLFIIGLIPALLVFWIRRNVEEPDVFVAMKASAARGDRLRFVEIFGPTLRRRTLLASLLAAGGLGGNYVILTWLATYLKTVRQLSVLGTGGYLGINIFGSFLGYVISAHLSDWLGRRKTFVLMAVAAAITVSCYTLLPLGNTAVLLLGFPLGFFQSGIIAGMGATFAELFPTRVRGTGQGFSYNTGRAIGSFVPTLVGVAAPSVGLGQAMGVCAASSYMLVLLAVALLPETRGRELESTVAPRERDAITASYSPQPVPR